MQGLASPSWGSHPQLHFPAMDSGCPSPAPHPVTSQMGYFGPSWHRAHPASSCPGQDGGTSWLCRAAHRKLLALMPVLPGLLAGLWVQPHAGPGHLVIGRGSGEVCVAPTHTRLSHRHQGPSPRPRARSGTTEGTQDWPGRASPGSPACTTARALLARRGKEPGEEENRCSRRTSGHRFLPVNKILWQSNGFSISSRMCCQTTPSAQSMGESLITALSAHPSAGGGRSQLCSRCRDSSVLPPPGLHSLESTVRAISWGHRALRTPCCHLLCPASPTPSPHQLLCAGVSDVLTSTSGAAPNFSLCCSLPLTARGGERLWPPRSWLLVQICIPVPPAHSSQARTAIVAPPQPLPLRRAW